MSGISFLNQSLQCFRSGFIPLWGECLSFCDKKERARLAAVNSHLNKVKIFFEKNLGVEELMGLQLSGPVAMPLRKFAFWLRENCSQDFVIFQNTLSFYARNINLETLETLVSCFSTDSPDPILERRVTDCFRTILEKRGGNPVYKSEIREADGSVFHKMPQGQRGPEGWLVYRGAQQGRVCWYEIAQRMFPLFNCAHPFVC
jgi:hypothetical protein